MASYKEYKCEGCGYTVNANPKGMDMVMMGEINSYLCSDCKEIVDVVNPHGRSLKRSFVLSVAPRRLRSGILRPGNVRNVVGI